MFKVLVERGADKSQEGAAVPRDRRPDAPIKTSIAAIDLEGLRSLAAAGIGHCPIGLPYLVILYNRGIV